MKIQLKHKTPIHRDRKWNRWLSETEGTEEWQLLLMGTEFLFGMMKKFWNGFKFYVLNILNCKLEMVKIINFMLWLIIKKQKVGEKK